jgi:hypothetical protein
MPKSMTQEMVEAGIGSLGDDDARPTALVVADMYAAIRSASPAPGEEVRGIIKAAFQQWIEQATTTLGKEADDPRIWITPTPKALDKIASAILCALGGEE